MNPRRLINAKWLLFTPLLLVLVLAIACGEGDTPAPIVIEKEVVVEKEVVKEVVEEVLVEKEVVKEIVKEVPVVVVATPTPGPKPAAMEKLTGTLKIAVAAFQHEALDMGFSSTTAKTYSGHMFDYLIGATEGGELTAELGLATKWTIAPDAGSVLFNLRKGVEWHDGVPFTASDVAFTLKRYSAEEATCTFCGQMRRGVDKVVAIDPYTADVILKKPDLTFFSTLSSRDTDMVMQPRHNFKANADGTYEILGDPIGTGQMKYVSRKLGQSITYEANTDYWNQNYPPTWAGRQIIQLPEASVRLNALRAGEIDMAQVESDQVPQATKLGFRIDGPKARGTYIINYLNPYDPKAITNNLDFRKALAISIDMDAVVDALFTPGTYTRAATAFFTMSAVVGYDGALKPYPYDPEEAKKLVKASGYDGRPLKIWSLVQTAWCPVCPDLMELAQGFWKEVGINSEILPLDWTSFRPSVVKADWDTDKFAAHISTDRAPGRPLALQNLLISWNSVPVGGLFQAYPDLDEVDGVMEKAGAAKSMEELDKIIRAFNQSSYALYPAIPVVSINETWALGPNIESWEPGDMGFCHNWETIKQKR